MRQGFEGVQALRALAALAVAVLHIADEAGALRGMPGHSPWPWLDALPLEAGVDLFFVISGFVLVWASWDAFGSLRAVPPFIVRRLLRVAPLYWLLTGVTILAGAALPGLLSEGLAEGSGYLVASALFIPWRRADGFVQPVLRLGWTLEYEMLFYALLACALPLPRRAGLAALLAAIAVLVIAGQLIPFAATPLAFWTDPIVLEFALGVLIALAARAGGRAGWPGVLALMLACAAAAMAAQFSPADIRVLVRGVPCALLVFCALSIRQVAPPVLLVGDASYALYLIHPFPMRALRVLATHLPLPSLIAPLAYVCATLAVAVALAILLHRGIEQPILRWGRRLTAEAVEITG